jgi:hypothetical protein
VLSVGTCWFGVPIKGSLPLLLAIAMLFLISTLAIGLLISTVAKTQYEAFQLSSLSLLPSVFLSGFIYPIAAMPAALQVVSRIFPLTYFLVVVRGILIKGISLATLLPQVIMLAIFGVMLIALAALRFRKRTRLRIMVIHCHKGPIACGGEGDEDCWLLAACAAHARTRRACEQIQQCSSEGKIFHTDECAPVAQPVGSVNRTLVESATTRWVAFGLPAPALPKYPRVRIRPTPTCEGGSPPRSSKRCRTIISPDQVPSRATLAGADCLCNRMGKESSRLATIG